MVTCPIDLNFLENPRLLPCGHAFCCKCLNKYMEKLTNNHPSFQCPICRAACFIPPDRNANSFPKAFNHIVILDFIQKNRPINGENQKINIKSSADDLVKLQPSAPPLPPSNDCQPPSRKSSMQVSSQLLNYIVEDLTSNGTLNSSNQTEILNQVNKLLQNLHPSQGTTQNGGKVFNRQQHHHHQGLSSTPSSISPTNSIKQMGGRFQAAASRIKRLTKGSISLDGASLGQDYAVYRDAESVRILMKRQAHFRVLSKGKDCCIMSPGEQFQPVDSKIHLDSNNRKIVQRLNASTNSNRTELIMWTLNDSSADMPYAAFGLKNATKSNMQKISSKVLIDGSNPIKVQYLRFHNSTIYLTGILTHTQHDDETKTSEFGLLVCCSINDNNNNNKENCDQESYNPFPIQATSSLFYRDSVGSQRRDQPIVLGLDIDRATGDIYIAQPANAMICRLKSHDLGHIDRTWYLNDPQLSPYFVCYAKSDNNVWATCPSEDKIIILDLEVDGYFHFTPSVSFGIVPSHIIYTSDSRIVVLDQMQCCLYWIAKVDKAICIQRLVFQLARSDKLVQILAIQPIDNNGNPTTINHFRRLESIQSTDSCSANWDTLYGGIMCAHNYGCSIIYPRTIVNRKRPIYSCFQMCQRS